MHADVKSYAGIIISIFSLDSNLVLRASSQHHMKNYCALM